MEQATAEGAKYASRCEALAALLADTRDRLRRARAEQVERARAEQVAWAAEAEAEARAEAERARAAAEAAADAERVRLEERRAALSSELLRVQAQLGDAPPAAPPSQPEEGAV